MTMYYPVWLMIFVLVAAVDGAAVPAKVCLREATYNPVHDRCDCDNGFEGDGELCCFDSSEYRLCEILGDPVLYSSYNTDLVMDIPCAQSLSLTETQEDSHVCRVQVFANNKYVVAGNIYHDRFTLAIQIDDARERYLHVLGHTFWHPIKSELIRREDLDDPSNKILNFDGVRFRVSFNENDNMWTITGCGVVVKSRKFKVGRLNQAMMPGMCIQTPRDQPYRSVNDGNLCGLKPTYSIWPYANLQHKLLANVLLQQLTLEGQEDVGLKTNKIPCLAAGTSFNKCIGSPKRKLAIQRCAGIVLHPTIRLCVVAAGWKEADIMTWFATCIDASCSPFSDSCNKLKRNWVVRKCLRQTTLKCPDW